jgi:hypothetical protein
MFNVAGCDERVSDCSIAAPCAQQPTVQHGPSTGCAAPQRDWGERRDRGQLQGAEVCGGAG